MKKPRADARGFLEGDEDAYLRNFRRAKPASPIKPLPSRVIVPGSGTTEAGPLEANPVLGPQFEPEAVQKWTTKPVNWLAFSPVPVRVNVTWLALTTPPGAPFTFLKS